MKIIIWFINELLAMVFTLLFLLAIIIFHPPISRETAQVSLVIIFFGYWILFNQLDMIERN